MASLLEQEIAEQGVALCQRASEGAPAAAQAAHILRRADVTHLVVAARGSSDNAARFAQYLFGDEIGLQTGLAAPWLFRVPAQAPRLTGAAVLGISQSGQSPDVVNVLAGARLQRRPTIAITVDPASPLACQADVAIPLLVGEERSVAATKTYLASLHALVQIVEVLAPAPCRRAWLERLPELVGTLAVEMLGGRRQFDALKGVASITVTGRGLYLSAAHESALKLRELSGLPAEAFSPPDLMHGPIAALNGTGAVWLIEPALDDLDHVQRRSAVSVVVADDQAPRGPNTIFIPLPAGAPAWVKAILAVLPAQAAALRLAEVRGAEVDAPHGLSKVTLTY